MHWPSLMSDRTSVVLIMAEDSVIWQNRSGNYKQQCLIVYLIRFRSTISSQCSSYSLEIMPLWSFIQAHNLQAFVPWSEDKDATGGPAEVLKVGVILFPIFFPARIKCDWIPVLDCRAGGVCQISCFGRLGHGRWSHK